MMFFLFLYESVCTYRIVDNISNNRSVSKSQLYQFKIQQGLNTSQMVYHIGIKSYDDYCILTFIADKKENYKIITRQTDYFENY